MARFSERYGYTEPASVLIRESMPEEMQNAICTAYDLLQQLRIYEIPKYYEEMEEYLWRYFLNKRLSSFHDQRGRYCPVATPFIESNEQPWFKKLDLIEITVSYFWSKRQGPYYRYFAEFTNIFVTHINSEFKRLNYAYRIIDNQIVEITSEEEIKAIETAVQNSSASVKEHLNTALQLLAKRPDGDYRNSIKESISAVEAAVREITGAKTLDFAALERKGVTLPDVLRKAFEKLYGYANDASTGIRHALMDDANAPSADEAIFMLVSCSAFINYIAKKRT